VVVLAAAGTAFVARRQPSVAPAAVQPALQARPLSMAEWLAGHSSDWRVARLLENTAVLVIEFPTLAEQGAALNRVAALLEKADAPRDRVLTDAELAALIARAGGNARTFYQGHDYEGSGLVRFFALAKAQGLRLNPQEERLRQVLVDTGMLLASADGLKPDGAQALISFTATQPDDPSTPADEAVDERRRDAILRHEASHGRFYTRPAYRAHCERFWREVLSDAQRELMRRYLSGLGYDRRDEELMLNETQALLMHTADTRAFNAGAVGMTEAELADLRSRFWRDLPADAGDASAAPEARRPAQ
jgi:hypothetical protein